MLYESDWAGYTVLNMCADGVPAFESSHVADSHSPGVYELRPHAEGMLPSCEPEATAADDAAGAGALDDSLLAANVVWCCQLRWVIIAAFTVFGLLGVVPDFFESLGLRSPGFWPFATAAVLAVANVGFLTAIRAATARMAHPAGYAMGILWIQILLDLIVVTCVVYFVGSMRTYAPFVYLFHITLACIFLPHRQSLAVTLTACVLYAACITAEYRGWLPLTHMFVDPTETATSGPISALSGLNFLMAMVIWLVMWYLVSHLATTVRQRDTELAAANNRLEAAIEERRRHMLTTTHQLKAPFAAIQANTQLLLGGYCGTLPDQAVDVTERIRARCQALAAEIQEMLQLANLRSASQQPLSQAPLGLAELLDSTMATLETTANERDITFKRDLQRVTVLGAEEHLTMLFVNLLSNAINYSYDGGKISVACGPDGYGAVRVSIADRGIGIPAEKLSRIFEQHYRTNEAVKHNKQSTGLGLAIVEHVARLYDIRVRVTSALGHGTTFELLFPLTIPNVGRTQT